MPIVSIIIPIYNVEKYLPQCIDSILSQTFTDFELLLVDDGSPDSCGDICERYAEQDSRICVLHRENGGVSAARNSGLDIARGEYVTFCDPDDSWAPNFLEVMLAEVYHTGADSVVCNHILVDESGRVLGTQDNKTGLYHITDEVSRFDFLVHRFMGGDFTRSVSTKIFRAEIIRKHNLRFCTTCQNYSEDWGFSFMFYCYAKIVSSIPDVLYFYLHRTGSMTQNSLKILKLDQMNELSKYVAPSYHEVFHHRPHSSAYPLVHFMFLCPEYKKIACKKGYNTLGMHSKKIVDKKWHTHHIRRLKWRYNVLRRFWGKNLARRSLLFASYIKHGSWKRFTLESAITYKFFVR